MEEYHGKFFGPNKIVEVLTEDLKTPLGTEIFEVRFENGQSRLMTKLALDHLTTESELDLTSLRDMKFRILCENIANQVLEYGLRYDEIVPLSQHLGQKLETAFGRALSFLWTQDDEQFVAGVNPIDNKDILEVEKILRGIAPAGGGEEKTEEQTQNEPAPEQPKPEDHA